MKRRKGIASIGIFVCGLLFTVGASAQQTWHAGSNFSAFNPSGQWSYGDDKTGSFTLYPTYSPACEGVPNFNCWNTGNNNVPIVGHNPTGSTICDGSAVIPPGLLLVHPGQQILPHPDDSIVRWSAQANGTYVITGGFFELLDDSPTAVTVSVLLNGNPIFGPTTLAGPPAQCPNPGGQVTIPKIVRTLVTGDTISFVVNSDGYYLNDSTGFDVTIISVLETGGTWTPVTKPPSTLAGAGTTLLLTDGTVLVHSEQSNLSDWYTLTPDAQGSYIKGTWTKVDSMPTGYAPLYFASVVLPDGRAIVEGGEYNLTNTNEVWTNVGAIYDPTQPLGSRWSPVAPPPGWATIGDAQSVLLPDGTFMLANCCTDDEAEMVAPYLGGSSWVPTGTFKHDLNDEEGWTLLPGPPDAEVLLTVDTSVITDSLCTPYTTASEIYINGYWFCNTSNTPTQLWDTSSHELGPAVLRPDGTVFQTGANTANGPGQTAIFDDGTFTWAAGPSFTCAGCPNNLDIADGPAALLPNGNVLMMTSPGVFQTGAVFFELQYGTNTLAEAPAPPNAMVDSSYYGHMLVLPTGQILFTDFSKDVEIYTPNDLNYDPSWAPQIRVPCGFCRVHTTHTNTWSGLRFNGMS